MLKKLKEDEEKVKKSNIYEQNGNTNEEIEKKTKQKQFWN